MTESTLADVGYPTVEFGDEVVTKEVPLSDARAGFTTIVSDVARTGVRMIVTRYGKPEAAIVPMFDLKRLTDLDNKIRNNLRYDRSSDEELVDFIDMPEGGAGNNAVPSGAEHLDIIHDLLSIPSIKNYVSATAAHAVQTVLQEERGDEDHRNLTGRVQDEIERELSSELRKPDAREY